MIAAESFGLAGPGVIFLHGAGQTRRSWTAVAAAAAAAGSFSVNVDLRGHGDSEWAPDRDYSYGAFVADLAAVVPTAGPRPVLVGASLGGLAALLLEGERTPGTAGGLVLVDVSPRVQESGLARVREFMTAHRSGFATIEDAAMAIAVFKNEPLRDDTERLRGSLRQSNGRWFWHWDPAVIDPANPVDVDERWQRLSAAARQVHVPVLFIRGGQSDLVDDAAEADLVRLVPHAEILHLPHEGHMIVGDTNAPGATAILQFLDRLRGASA